jgi:hypothetical protein
MGAVVIETFVIALAVAISPMRSSAAILVLLSDHARRSGPMFLAGFVCGITLATAAGLFLSRSISPGAHHDPPTAISIVILAAGFVLLGIAARSWQSRPRDDAIQVLPAWLREVESLSPFFALLLGFGLAVLSFKNMGLILVATLLIAQEGLSPVTETAMAIVFVLVASLGVALPVGWFLIADERATTTLTGWKAWMTQHNVGVTAVSTALGGLLLVAKGLADLIG